MPEASRASRKPSGFRSKAASRPPPSNAGSERRHHRTRRRNAATVRPCAACQSIRRPFDRAGSVPPDSGEHRNAATVRGIDSGMSRGQAVATVCRLSAVRPFDRVPPDSGNRSRRPLSIYRKPRPGCAAPPFAPIPANVRRFSPPCAQPLAVRLAIAATVRFSPAYFAPKTPLQAVATVRHHRTRRALVAPWLRRHHRQAVRRSTVCRLSAIPANIERAATVP